MFDPMNKASVTSPPKAARAAAKAAIALAVGACAVGTAPAWASVYNPAHLAPDQLGQVEAICQTAMGLSDSLSTQHYACVESLSHSFTTRLKAGRLLAARQDCLGRGLRPGTVALSECELTARPQQAPQDVEAEAGTIAPLPRVKSYFDASFDEIRRREQRACAEIGYDPVNAGFGQCVADLATYLDVADHSVD